MKLSKADWKLLFAAVSVYPDYVYVKGATIRCASYLRYLKLVRRISGFTIPYDSSARSGSAWGNKDGTIQATKAGRVMAYQRVSAKHFHFR